MPDHPTATTRRTTLGALVLGTAGLSAALAGCDLDDVLPGDGAPALPGRDPGPDADERLLEEVRGEVAAALLLVTEVRDGQPRLRPALAGLVRMHEAHLAALGSPPSTAPSPAPGGPADPAGALALVRRFELRHQRRLAGQAVRADSGRLAQLVASMSAGVAQQVTLLPRSVRP